MIILDLEAYVPFNEQEVRDKELMLKFLRDNRDAFCRSNLAGHMTASAWVVNKARDKVLMAYSRRYDSWAWLGGHADGEEDLLAVALRECREESGVRNVRALSTEIFSLELLAVSGHEKKGEYVPSHLYYNVTYLLEADENDELKVCADENSAVAWLAVEEAFSMSTEPWFVERIYKKLNEKQKMIK